jgi:hypothetical protein
MTATSIHPWLLHHLVAMNPNLNASLPESKTGIPLKLLKSRLGLSAGLQTFRHHSTTGVE